jgi:hypothetical protein
MLKDILKSMAEGGNPKFCKLGEIYRSMDKETQEAFSLVLRSDATTMDICRALKSDGIQIGREFLGAKRRCFKTNDPTCCLNLSDGSTK